MPAKILARKNKAMWPILLATEDQVKALADCILTTNLVRLQTEYLGTRQSKVTLHSVPLFKTEYDLDFFFSKFRDVSEVASTDDIEIAIKLNRKRIIEIDINV